MAEKEQPKLPTHRAYSVIRREGQDDFWLNIGLVFPHKDDAGFNIMLQAIPFDGKVVCRKIDENDEADDRSTKTPPRRDNARDREDQFRRERPSRSAR